MAPTLRGTSASWAIVDRAHTASGDVRRRRRDGGSHRFGRQCPVGEGAGERCGEAVAGPARVAPLDRRRDHQRCGLTLDEQCTSCAQCHDHASRVPATGEQLCLLGHTTHVGGEGQSGHRRRLGLVGGDQAGGAHGWRSTRMRIPHDLATDPPLECGADVRVGRDPAAVVGHQHDVRFVERAARRRARRTDHILRGPMIEAQQRVLARADANLLRRRAAAAQVDDVHSLVVESLEQFDAGSVVGDAGDERHRSPSSVRRVWRRARHRPDACESCGAGTRFKIIEAMAAGVPVVSTPKGIEGLELVPGRDVLVGDMPADLARLAAELWDDPEGSARLAARAREVVETHYSRRRAADRIRVALLAAGLDPRNGVFSPHPVTVVPEAPKGGTQPSTDRVTTSAPIPGGDMSDLCEALRLFIINAGSIARLEVGGELDLGRWTRCVNISTCRWSPGPATSRWTWRGSRSAMRRLSPLWMPPAIASTPSTAGCGPSASSRVVRLLQITALDAMLSTPLDRTVAAQRKGRHRRGGRVVEGAVDADRQAPVRAPRLRWRFGERRPTARPASSWSGTSTTGRLASTR